jgi:hypothetical protein
MAERNECKFCGELTAIMLPVIVYPENENFGPEDGYICIKCLKEQMKKSW